MNFKNLWKLSTLVFLFTIVISSLSYGQTVRYLNSTDGDDTYTGVNPTNSPLGTGPMRTLEGAFSAFADGATVYMTAGTYNYAGVGSTGDDNGYLIRPADPAVTNKSMTFIVQTYLSNSTVTLNGTGGDGFSLVIGTGTLTFQPTTPGVEKITLNATGGQAINLTSGTLDISAMTGTGGFTIGANYTTINVTSGTIVGTPTFSAANRTLTYTNSASLTAGGEVPSNLGTLALNPTVTAKTVTFNNPINFVYNGGGITTGGGTATVGGTFNGLVTLTNQQGAAQATATIVNTKAGTLLFAGGINIISTLTDNGIPINNNNATGKITVSGPLTLNQFDGGGGVSDNASHYSMIKNTLGGTLTLSGGISGTATAFGSGSDYSVARTPFVSIANTSTGIYFLGGPSVATTISGNFNSYGAGTATLGGSVTIQGNFSNVSGHTFALASNTLTLTKAGGAFVNAGNITSTGVGSGLLLFNLATTGTSWTGTGGLPNIQKDGSALLTITQATAVTGNVTSNRGGITFTGSDVTISGTLTVNTPSAGNNVVTITNNGGGALTTIGNVAMNGGGITIPNGVTAILRTTNYTQNGGTLIFNDGTLDIKGNFVRNVGTVTPGTGLLQFSGGGIAQTFSGGTNLQIYSFRTIGTNTTVTISNGSVEVNHKVNIGPDSKKSKQKEKKQKVKQQKEKKQKGKL